MHIQVFEQTPKSSLKADKSSQAVGAISQCRRMIKRKEIALPNVNSYLHSSYNHRG